MRCWLTPGLREELRVLPYKSCLQGILAQAELTFESCITTLDHSIVCQGHSISRLYIFYTCTGLQHCGNSSITTVLPRTTHVR